MGETLRSHFTPNQMTKRHIKQKKETIKSLDRSYNISALSSDHISASLEDLDSNFLDGHMVLKDVLRSQLTKVLQSSFTICADNQMVMAFPSMVNRGFKLDVVSRQKNSDLSPFFR
jgi:hypothetical protein